MVEISHETPLCYLEKSREINDYDYCLVHLLDHPDNSIAEQYFSFFYDSLCMGRKVILDNSAFELNGEPFNKERYIYWIEKLQPTEYIVPDVRDDAYATVDSVEEWFNLIYTNKKVRNIKAIGVAHGKTYRELLYCYSKIEPLCSKMAFSFEPFFFKETSLSSVRFEILKNLERVGIINTSKPHHLLGCILPQEFKLWRDVPWIETIDTSSPVLHAFEGIKFKDNEGLLVKSKTKIDDIFISATLSKEVEELIDYNCKIFRSFFK